MKLRTRSNSLRLRLSQREVKRIADGERVVEVIEFGGTARFEYALVASAEVSAIAARLDGATIDVVVPRAAAIAWANSNEVGMSVEQTTDSTPLSILIEKDFACLTPRGSAEDESDAFPHPAAHDPKATC